MSAHAGGGTILIVVTARAILSAGTSHLSLSARESRTPGTWSYTLGDGTDARAQFGRVAGMTDHMRVLRYAADVCAAGYQPGTTERELLEQFADGVAGSRAGREAGDLASRARQPGSRAAEKRTSPCIGARFPARRIPPPSRPAP